VRRPHRRRSLDRERNPGLPVADRSLGRVRPLDLLYERAGSQEVIEVHGSIRTSSCSRCGRAYPLRDVLPLVEATGIPRCAHCSSVLKPDVIFFGELLPADEMARASELARSAGLLLVVGSSLEVHPVAGLPEETLEAGGRLAIVNRDPTPYDSRSALRVSGSAREVLAEVARVL